MDALGEQKTQLFMIVLGMGGGEVEGKG